MEIDDLPGIEPLSFFSLRFSIPYVKEFSLNQMLKAKGSLPRLDGLCERESFADVALAWNEEELGIALHVEKPFESSGYPDLQSGDSFELFIDTRDLKNVHACTQFCHHFFILPEPVEEIQAGEITRLRADQVRPLADPLAIRIETQIEKKSYRILVCLGKEALFGYDPETMRSLGFAYRINRPDGESQILASSDFKIETQPNHWASLTLTQ